MKTFTQRFVVVAAMLAALACAPSAFAQRILVGNLSMTAGSGAPTSTVEPAGSVYTRTDTGQTYVYNGTAWLAGAAFDANGALNVGGLQIAGAASTATTITKAVSAFTDTVAKAVFTVTVPNAAHAAVVDVDVVGVLGAGGAIGAGEATRVSKYQVVLSRTAGVNVVATASAAVGGAEAHVAGATSIASVVVSVSSITGAVGAVNTFTINVAITKTGGASDNHTAVASARVLNQNAAGVTIQ